MTPLSSVCTSFHIPVTTGPLILCSYSFSLQPDENRPIVGHGDHVAMVTVSVCIVPKQANSKTEQIAWRQQKQTHGHICVVFSVSVKLNIVTAGQSGFMRLCKRSARDTSVGRRFSSFSVGSVKKCQKNEMKTFGGHVISEAACKCFLLRCNSNIRRLTVLKQDDGPDINCNCNTECAVM